MPKTNRKYCTPSAELRAWLEDEAQRLNVPESTILVQALDRYRTEAEARRMGSQDSGLPGPARD